MNSEFRFAQSGTLCLLGKETVRHLSGWVSFLVLQLSVMTIRKNQSPNREKKAQVLGPPRPLWLCSGKASFTEWYHSACQRGENQRLGGPATCPRSHKDYKKSTWGSMLDLWIPNHESLISLTLLPREMQAVGGPLEGECDIKPGFIV